MHLEKILAFKPKNKLPIIGIEGSGKTCFAWGLEYFLSENRWGGAAGKSRDYFRQITPAMLRNEGIAATYGNRRLEFQIGRLVVSTYDIAGEDFRQAMEVLSQPTENPKNDKGVKQFLSLVEHSIGLIVIVDLARRIKNRETFAQLPQQQQAQHILNALSEQVVPLGRGVEYMLSVNKHLTQKMLYFIFTKTDIHGVQVKPGKNILTTAYAPLFAHLETQGIKHREYSVAYTGCRITPDQTVEYGIQGLEEFVTDLHQFSMEK